jgi:hypothetical protein
MGISSSTDSITTSAYFWRYNCRFVGTHNPYHCHHEDNKKVEYKYLDNSVNKYWTSETYHNLPTGTIRINNKDELDKLQKLNNYVLTAGRVIRDKHIFKFKFKTKTSKGQCALYDNVKFDTEINFSNGIVSNKITFSKMFIDTVNNNVLIADEKDKPLMIILVNTMNDLPSELITKDKISNEIIKKYNFTSYHTGELNLFIQPS